MVTTLLRRLANHTVFWRRVEDVPCKARYCAPGTSEYLSWLLWMLRLEGISWSQRSTAGIILGNYSRLCVNRSASLSEGPPSVRGLRY